MKTLWYIAQKDLLQVVKDRNALILMLVVPLVLITVVGFALGNLFGDGSSQIKIKVALSNHDAGIGQTISRALDVNTKDLLITVSEYPDTAQVTARVNASNDAADVGIVIPTGASQAVLDAGQSTGPTKNLIQFYTLPNNSTSALVTIVRNIVNNVVQEQRIANASALQVHQVCSQPGNVCAPKTINDAAISSAVVKASQASDQAIVSQTVGQATKVNTFDQVVPGYAIFFSLFGLNAVAATILQEQEDGTFRRLLIAPIQKYALLGGKLLAQFLLTLVQLTVLFTVGYFAFKMDIPSWPAVILLLIATSFAATGLGILLVSVVKSRRQINPIVSLVTLITSAIGGAWWPLFSEPTWMQQLAKVGITAWAMEGLNGTMLFGKSFSAVLPDILGLLIYGAICFIVALRLFSFQPKTAVA